MDTLRFYFVTWNVATKSPGQDLNSLLDFPSQYNKNKILPDFYVIGLQEVKSQPQNLLMDSLFIDPWTSSFNKILCRQGYISAKSIRLQGILLLVYTQIKHVTHLRDIEAQYTKTGLGGIWGNKGAVSVRFNIYGCSVCLVNCHLAAHEHLLAERIQDYNTIIRQHAYHVGETTNILYHDYVFWIGDLNFRTDHPSNNSPTSEEIVEQLQRIEKDKYTNLLKHDQLLAVMDCGEAFSEFTESEIRFPPTYKFNIGTDDYDLKRKPSWTDRILYKVIADNYENITLRADLISYNHIPHYTVSDHKPVVGQFNIKVRCLFSRLAPNRLEVSSSIRMRSAMIPPPMDKDPPTDPDESNFGNLEYYGITYLNSVCGCDPKLTNEADGVIVTGVNKMDEPVLEAFSNYTEKTVEFAPISRIWYIGDADFRTQCTLSPDVVINPNDWIGIYDANFHSLDDYIAYEYIAKVSVGPAGEHRSGAGAGAGAEGARTIVLSFPVGSGVRTPGFYRFIYFSQPNNDVRSVLGISDPFEVSSKQEALVAMDLNEQSTSSTSPNLPNRKSTTATTDIFTDFTGLDVTKLSRHFSNDLSID